MAKKTEQKGEENPQLALPMVLRAQYLKDLSFENPNPLGAFTSQSAEQPNINVDIQVKAQNLGNSNFEVILEVKANATRDKDTLFVVECDYAGLVTLGDVDEKDVEPLIMIQCPHLIFPFVRNIVAEATRNGGYPPLFISPIDFAALFRQQKQDGTTGISSDAAAQQPSTPTQSNLKK